ncbi:hypothetical protein TMES_08480 [Thalassospira mesophila]|uniref:Uncharacterized protein n=1 Tax=Thalassospira mesophila TaxID=1293891 RepID=A0A1Y2L0Q6_9PROT|nr:hypothetical protein TMES_08480 [Thalassospira mesophila]
MRQTLVQYRRQGSGGIKNAHIFMLSYRSPLSLFCNNLHAALQQPINTTQPIKAHIPAPGDKDSVMQLYCLPRYQGAS